MQINFNQTVYLKHLIFFPKNQQDIFSYIVLNTDKRQKKVKNFGIYARIEIYDLLNQAQELKAPCCSPTGIIGSNQKCSCLQQNKSISTRVIKQHIFCFCFLINLIITYPAFPSPSQDHNYTHGNHHSYHMQNILYLSKKR